MRLLQQRSRRLLHSCNELRLLLFLEFQLLHFVFSIQTPHALNGAQKAHGTVRHGTARRVVKGRSRGGCDRLCIKESSSMLLTSGRRRSCRRHAAKKRWSTSRRSGAKSSTTSRRSVERSRRRHGNVLSLRHETMILLQCWLLPLLIVEVL